MLQLIAPHLWHVQRNFKISGLHISSRMTVVRLSDGSLWLHSPIRLNQALIEQLRSLGDVRFIVAPNKTHHLFAASALAAFPNAQLFGAPGLPQKRPDLLNMQELTSEIPAAWQSDLDQIFFEGIPFGNETAWLHRSSSTLILTDLCQWWQGDLPLMTRCFASMTGVRKELAVAKTVRLAIKDREAASRSAQKILRWDFDRVIVAHNAIIDSGAHAAVEKAFGFLLPN